MYPSLALPLQCLNPVDRVVGRGWSAHSFTRRWITRMPQTSRVIQNLVMGNFSLLLQFRIGHNFHKSLSQHLQSRFRHSQQDQGHRLPYQSIPSMTFGPAFFLDRQWPWPKDCYLISYDQQWDTLNGSERKIPDRVHRHKMFSIPKW